MSEGKRSLRAGVTIMAAALTLAGCSGTTENPIILSDSTIIEDPFEETNRAVFAFNDALDKAIARPVAKGYRAVVPKPARTGLSNFLRNLKSPMVFVNQVLQGDAEGAGNVFTRTIVNTLIGVGGIFDVAGHEGIEYEPEDFGQTLAVWGAGHGPYMVLPLLGPSSLRDYSGYAVDSLADPLRWYLFNIGEEHIYYTKTGLEYISAREELLDVLDDLERSSIDYYAAVRSSYYQRREALVNDENPPEGAGPVIPDYDDF